MLDFILPITDPRCYDIVDTLRYRFTVTPLKSLTSRQCKHFCRIAKTGNDNALIDHCFRNLRISSPMHFGIPRNRIYRIISLSLGRRTYRRPHIRLILIGHSLARLVHNRCGTYIRPLPHVNAIAGNSNQSPGRSSIVIDKSIHGHRAVKNQRAYRIGMYDRTAIGIKTQYDGRRTCFPGLIIPFLHIPPRSSPDLFIDIYSIKKRCFRHVTTDNRIRRK